MVQDQDMDTRLADEVTALLTRLVTEVEKLLRLEETLVQLRREHTQIKARVLEMESAEKGRKLAEEELTLLREANTQLLAQKRAAEAKNKQLEGEVEDLTASLFNEANEMVLNASREAYNFKLKNRKLIEELADKDLIITSLQSQLHDLKELFVKMDDQQRTASRSNTPRTEKGRFDFSLEPTAHEKDVDPPNAVLQQLLYGVRAPAVRFDVPAYQLDFKAFVYQLIKPGFAFDLASLRTLKYFRKLWTDELEPCIPVIPSLTGNTFMSRWSKGKSFWGLLAEGKAIIEPVAGVNETFKLTYKGAKRGSLAPVALKDACAFCGEQKDDLLEHARLYNLKLYGPTTETGVSGSTGSTTEIGGEPHAVVGTYPLCNFCLVKLRAICTFFARLRLVHANIYKLKQNSSFDDVAYVNSFQFKRSSESLQAPELDPEAEPIFVKLYLMMLVLRAKIFWSRTGFWDTDEDIEFLKLDEIPVEDFRALVQDNVAFQLPDLGNAPEVIHESVPESEHPATEVKSVSEQEQAKAAPRRKKPVEESLDEPASVKQATTTKDTVSPVQAGETGVVFEPVARPVAKATDPVAISVAKSVSEPAEPVAEVENKPSTTEAPEAPEAATETITEQPTISAEAVAEPKGKNNKKKGNKTKNNAAVSTSTTTEAEDAIADEAGDAEFQDSLDSFDQPPLQRRKSKSKEFKAKINKDLDNTLAALKESLE